jgi:hypothetical protein
MITEACMLIGGAIGALIGAGLSTTEKGQELDEKLKDAMDVFDNKVSKYLPDKKRLNDLIEGGK